MPRLDCSFFWARSAGWRQGFALCQCPDFILSFSFSKSASSFAARKIGRLIWFGCCCCSSTSNRSSLKKIERDWKKERNSNWKAVRLIPSSSHSFIFSLSLPPLDKANLHFDWLFSSCLSVCLRARSAFLVNPKFSSTVCFGNALLIVCLWQ